MWSLVWCFVVSYPKPSKKLSCLCWRKLNVVCQSWELFWRNINTVVGLCEESSSLHSRTHPERIESVHSSTCRVIEVNNTVMQATCWPEKCR